MTEFTQNVIAIIQSIPSGKVMTYGDVALRAGNNKAARAVSYILKSRSKIDRLPWHRVVGKGGILRIQDPIGFQLQKSLLESEGIKISEGDSIYLMKYRCL
jgi:methylated-DNA-protein-cysteine methyltransferase-like protein